MQDGSSSLIAPSLPNRLPGTAALGGCLPPEAEKHGIRIPLANRQSGTCALVSRAWIEILESSPRLVAVVEDDPSMRRGVSRLLNAHGFQTVLFASAEAFLDRDHSYRPMCVVLDVHLGGMGGIELWSRLRAMSDHLPVVFLTADEDRELERRAVEGGCVAFLRKPVAGDSLVNAVKKAIARSESG